MTIETSHPIAAWLRRIGAALAALVILAGSSLAQPRLPAGLIAAKGARTDEKSGLPLEAVSQKDGAEMALVPAGAFLMGDNNTRPDETPQHKVYVGAFYIDKYEVTNERYEKFLEATGLKQPPWWYDDNLNQPKQPVVGASWEDASAYCRWAGKALPTEAEWEKAARGADGRKYPWGNEPTAEGGKYRANYGPTADGFKYTAPVGSFPLNKSPYGCFDMAGNVWEWCADWYDADYYGESPASDPPGPFTGPFRVDRGGGWSVFAVDCRSAHRNRDDPSFRSFRLGFRVALVPSSQ